MSRRAIVLAVLTGAALLMTAPVSGAAQAAGISSADASAAHRAAAGFQDVLVGFFAQAPGAKGPVSVQIAPDAYPVYELSADFVAGKPGAAPGDFAYFAIPARASDGRTATLWSVRGADGTWQAYRGAELVGLSRSDAEGFYAVHRERPFFKDLVDFMTTGPVMVQVLEGESAIAKNRELMGATDPKKAAAGTIRADFAQSIDANAVHGSDAPETAQVEIAYFFPAHNVYSR